MSNDLAIVRALASAAVGDVVSDGASALEAPDLGHPYLDAEGAYACGRSLCGACDQAQREHAQASVLRDPLREIPEGDQVRILSHLASPCRRGRYYRRVAYREARGLLREWGYHVTELTLRALGSGWAKAPQVHLHVA